MIHRTGIAVMVSVTLLVPAAALAQWSSDPLLNLAVAAKTDEQVQPKVGTLADGSAYVSWFDNDSTGSPAYGYDVFLQYFNGSGDAQWASSGVRIADRGYSSTTDYGFAVDTAGNALLAFNDDRSGSDQITVTKVSTAGTQTWGPTGVQVSSGADPKYSPDVAATSDGGVAVGWSGSGRKGAGVFVAKLGADGGMLWSVTINAARGFAYDFSHLAAGDNGSVIVLWVRTDISPFSGKRRGLMAQKYSAKGRAMWGKGIVVLDASTLQNGEFPEILPDGAGGAVIGWYTTGPLESYVQRLSAAGVEVFPHNGVAAALNSNIRTEPSFAFDAATGDTIMVYHETGAGGDGVYGQRFAATGERRWGSDGIAIRPLDSITIMWPTVVNTPSGALVAWIEQVGYPDSQIYGARVDASGGLSCTGTAVTLASGSKNRIAAAATAAGGGIFAWEDGRNDFSDVYAQRLGSDCSLGLAR